MQAVLPQEFLRFGKRGGFYQDVETVDSPEFLDYRRSRTDQPMMLVPVESRDKTAAERFRLRPCFLPVLIMERQLDQAAKRRKKSIRRISNSFS